MHKKISLSIFFTWQLAMSAEALAICGSSDGPSLETMQEVSAEFIRDMTVSRARGDIATMAELYAGFYPGLVNACVDGTSEPHSDFWKICGLDCHIEVGSFHHFMSSDVFYYYSKATSEADQSPEDALVQSEQGIEILERAMAILRSQGVTGELRDYLKRSSSLELIRTKLYLAQGDIYYRNASETRLKRLEYLVQEAVDENYDDNNGSFLDLAQSAYERANWVLQSLSLEIPELEEFSRQRAEVAALKAEIDRRLLSLKEGLIYVGIDPEEFHPLSINQLNQELVNLENQIFGVEEKIDGMLRGWWQEKAGQSVDSINQERLARDVSMSQSSYRIAKIENDARKMLLDLEGAQELLSEQRDDYQHQLNQFQQEATLKLKVQELNNQKNLLMAKQELDVLDFESEGNDRAISDLRFMMNWAVSRANINVQLSEYESQLAQLQSDVQSTNKEIDKISNKKTIITKKISDLNYRINNVIANKKSALELEKNEIANERLKAVELEICNALNQISFYTGSAPSYTFSTGVSCQLPVYGGGQSYQQDMCDPSNGLRARINTTNEERIVNALCAIGFENLSDEIRLDEDGNDRLKCETRPGFTSSQLQLAQEIYEKEAELANTKISHISDQAHRLQNHIGTIIAKFTLETITKATLETVVSSAKAVVESTAASSVKVTNFVGPYLAGTSTEYIDTHTLAVSIYETTQEAYHSFLDWATYASQKAAELQQLNANLQILKDNTTEAKLVKAIQDQAAVKAVAEIIGKSDDLQSELLAQIINEEITIVDCDRANETLENNIKSSELALAGLMSDAALIDLSVENLDISLKIVANEEQEIRNQIDIYEVEDDNLDIELENWNNKIETLNTVIAQVKARQGIIKALSANLDAFEDEDQALTKARDEIRLLRQEGYLELTDTEINQIESVVLEQTSYTQTLLDFEDQLYEMSALDHGIRQQIIEYNLSVANQIGEERDHILELGTLQEEDASQTDQFYNIFMAKEEMLAALTNGIPEFVKRKRRLIEEANRLLVALRNQYRSVFALANNSSDPLSINSESPVLIKTGAELAQAREELRSSALWNTDRYITTNAVDIEIPAECGLSRTLVRDGFATFEISPFALQGLTSTRNRELGCFAMWDGVWSPDSFGLSQNLLLVDVNLQVIPGEESAACNRPIYQIKHHGNGYVFKEMGQGDQTLIPYRIATESRYISRVAHFSSEGTTLGQLQDYFRDTQFNIYNFPGASVPGWGDITPTFTGLPLMSLYSIYLGNLVPEDSDDTDAVCTPDSFKLHFSYITITRDNE